MTKGTKVAVGIGATAVLLLVGVIVHAIAPTSGIGRVLSAIGAAAGLGLAALWRASKGAFELITGSAGQVTGASDHFSAVDGDPTRLDVFARDEGKPYRVQLPAGIKSDQVRAVKVAPGGKATVEVLP